MPAAVPAILAITAATTAAAATYTAVDSNQQRQHAKGAAEAQETKMKEQVALAEKTSAADKKAKATQASSTQQSALAAIRANLSAGSSFGGTLLTDPNAQQQAPTTSKSLLGM